MSIIKETNTIKNKKAETMKTSNTTNTVKNEKYRYYQQEADDAIYKDLIDDNNGKCIVKMFCGTGKSLIMCKCKIIKNQKLVVFVFPTLGLITQFTENYLLKYKIRPNRHILKVSSESVTESTTDLKSIHRFLRGKFNKIICTTYNSYKLVIDNLEDTKIDVCIFDEAHHAVGETYQKLIFENENCEKQVFFTATPKNANGIVMLKNSSSAEEDMEMCGNLVYDYSYLRGLTEGYLNPFEIRIDLYTENTNKSIFESIARAILTSGNTRVLTFHADVNTDRDTSVVNFVDEALFRETFKEIQNAEFPENQTVYTNIVMVALSSSIGGKDRTKILNAFDSIQDNEIMVISSCETIGEGIDTKEANMCVFADPKSSFVKIIQNIGRIVRKEEHVVKPNSTILIPCWVDKNKYLECDGDREKCDEVIREDMGKDGNFNGILNVMSALKQEDEDIYDICLNYPESYSRGEIERNLERQKYEILEPIGEGYLAENVAYLLDVDDNDDETEDYEYETEEEEIMDLARKNNVCIEIHTDSLENHVEKYNAECKSGNIIRLFKEVDDETENTVYCPIITKCGKKLNKDNVQPPNKNTRVKTAVHTNPDVKILWKITSGDFTKNMCSCVLDCEVIMADNWNERLVELITFFETNGRKPNTTSKNKKEKLLYIWISNNNTNCKNKTQGMKILERYDEWMNFINEHKDYFMNANEIWNNKYGELILFFETNKRKPNYNSKNKNEKTLYIWISKNNTNYKNKTQGMAIHERYNKWKNMINTYIKYFMDMTWNNKYSELILLFETNKKNSNYSPKIKEEKINQKWKKWIDSNNRNYKNKTHGMKIHEQYNKWSILLNNYKEYFMNADEIWNNKYDKLMMFVEINNRMPNHQSKNNEEHAMKQWVVKNNLNYKNNVHGMKNNEERKQQWGEFRKKYLKCNDNNIISVQNDLSNDIDDPPPPQPTQPKTTIKIKKKSMKLTVPTQQPEKESTDVKKQQIKTVISALHQKYKTMNSNNLNRLFKENQHEWTRYHEIAEENEKSFPEDQIPRNRIIQELTKIKTNRTKIVVDMGCGKAQISAHFTDDKRFQFLNYDHVSFQPNIISCDISNIPMEEHTVEICVLSLAMWGSNCKEYIAEANRILESGGILYIIEPTKRWSPKDELGNILPEMEGHRLKILLEKNGFHIVNKSIEKFSSFECVKI